MIKKIFKYILNLISRSIALALPDELISREISIDSLMKEDTTKECYEYFKEVFKTTILFKHNRDNNDIRKYAVENAISNDKQKELFYLEFGVYKGASTNFFPNM